MMWYFYQNADEPTQMFAGVVIIISIVFLVGANLFFWLQEKAGKKKK